MCRSDHSNHTQNDITPKYFSATIKVAQFTKELNLFGFLLFGMLGVVSGFWLSLIGIGRGEHESGWLSFLYNLSIFGAIFLVVIGGFGGLLAYHVWEEFWRKKSGQAKPFSQKTLVTMDENGITIRGLGIATWLDITGYEYIPDNASQLIIYARQYGRLMLSHDTSSLTVVLDYYLSQSREQELQHATASRATPLLFKAVIFHWPTFYTWILAGYLFSIAVGIGLFFSKPIYDGEDLFKLIVAVVVLMPTCAWLIWSIPFWQLSFFANKRSKTFKLKSEHLVSLDSTIDIDLCLAKVRFVKKSGIGYALSFISIKPQQGKQIDLLVNEEEQVIVHGKLKALGLIMPAPLR